MVLHPVMVQSQPSISHCRSYSATKKCRRPKKTDNAWNVHSCIFFWNLKFCFQNHSQIRSQNISHFLLRNNREIHCNSRMKTHYQGNLLSPWPQKMAVFSGQWWQLDPPTPHSPLLIKIFADKKRPLNQLTVKNVFFFINHQNILQLPPRYCSQKKQLIWLFEWRKSVHRYW